MLLKLYWTVFILQIFQQAKHKDWTNVNYDFLDIYFFFFHKKNIIFYCAPNQIVTTF